MDTDDYIMQCMALLMNHNIYRLAEAYPHATIKTLTENIVAPFKADLSNINVQLYNYLLCRKYNNETPKFYGIPKIHKPFTYLPHMQPIVAQSNSPLLPTAKFIEHALQSLAQSYDDYIQNSTSLILRLQTMHIPSTSVLVTVDVESLYPSIPHTKCLNHCYS